MSLTTAADVTGTAVAQFDEVRGACAMVFTDWLDDLAALLTPALGKEAARETAVLGLCALEGAFILSRTLRTTGPLHEAAHALETAVRGTVPGRTRA